MNANTTEHRHEGASERRSVLRRASDRELLGELNRRNGRCAQFGCEESAWHDSEFCLWHPTLQLAPQARTDHPGTGVFGLK